MKQIKVRRYAYRRDGKKVVVPGHVRRVKFNAMHLAPEDRVFSDELEEINAAKRDIGLMQNRKQIERLIEKQIRESRRRKARLYSDREHESEKLRRRNILYNQIILPDLDIRKVQRGKRKAKLNPRVKTGIGDYVPRNGRVMIIDENGIGDYVPKKRSAYANIMYPAYGYNPMDKSGGEYGTLIVTKEPYHVGRDREDVFKELGIRRIKRRRY